MKTGLVIFNGIQSNYYFINHVIDWAVKNDGDLHALFVHSDKEPPEGYIFPSDIDPAENISDEEDAEKANVKVIRAQIKLFGDMAKSKAVSARAEELVNPSLGEVVAFTKAATVLFVDANYDQAILLATTSFEFKDLIDKSKCPVEMVYDKK